ncbi:hypothetical protein QFC21_004415 [Naganishia friedmannii]|uniref:Uncharacterized protein n=1 Tax=Naganishia friedmannii TaxID=89922 RepID=A0ACC2VHJ8_9TREE|nr:hypothetical protein QFC21_004415 [Naganishia friedmannii]
MTTTTQSLIGKATSKSSTSVSMASHPYSRPSSTPEPEKKHITISLSDPTLTRYGDAIYDPAFLAIALDPTVSEKEKLKAARGVRNRLSAACSRQKRKELLDGLREENEALKREVEALRKGKDCVAVKEKESASTVAIVKDEPPCVAQTPPRQAPSADGTIDPTTLTDTPSPLAHVQSPHLALINQLIASSHTMQATITALVVDRDEWKEKYHTLLSSITQLGAAAASSQAYATPPPAEPSLLSPAKSTSSTLVSEYLLDVNMTTTSDRSSSSSSSASTPATSSTPTPFRSSLSPPLSLSVPENTTCHPAAVERMMKKRTGKSPAAGGVSSVLDGFSSGAGGLGLGLGFDNGLAGKEDDAVAAWSRLFHHNKADADVNEGEMMWIPSGLDLGLGLDLGFTDDSAVDMSFLPPTMGMTIPATTTTGTTAAEDEFLLSPSTGIMQTLFNHGGYLPASSHLDNTLALGQARGSSAGVDEPPMSAISSSDFVIPGFLDFHASASTSSCGTTGDDTSVFLDEEKAADDDDDVMDGRPLEPIV